MNVVWSGADDPGTEAGDVGASGVMGRKLSDDERAVREALLERNQLLTEQYREERREHRRRTVMYAVIVAAFVAGEVALWIVRYARRAEIVAAQTPLQGWLTGSFVVYLVSTLVAAALAVVVARHLRRSPVEPTLELPLDDPSRRPMTLRPDYVPPRRW